MAQTVSTERSDKPGGHSHSVAAATRGLLDLKAGPWVCPGPAVFSGTGTVELKGGFLYPPETNWGWVNFEGSGFGGVIAGGGAGIAVMVADPDELVNGGDVSFNLNAGGPGPGLWNINFSRAGKFLGSFNGGGIVEGVCVVPFGTCRFKRGRPTS